MSLSLAPGQYELRITITSKANGGAITWQVYEVAADCLEATSANDLN